MYGKPAMFQISGEPVWFRSPLSHQTAPTPYYRQPSPPSTFMLKSKGKTCMVNGPSHVKQLSLIHVCKIEVKMFFFLHVWEVWNTEYERLIIKMIF
jgi:hypothetical protein